MYAKKKDLAFGKIGVFVNLIVQEFKFCKSGLEPVCCKKRPKIVTGLGNKGPLQALIGTKLILDDHENGNDCFRINL